MNILLLVAPAPPAGTVPFVTTEKRPPLGVASLISSLRQAGHKVYFEDLYLHTVPLLYDARFLLDNAIDMVGMYTSSVTWGEALKLLQRLHGYRTRGLWQGILAVGGPHTSFNARKMPAWIDHIVIGEGEKTLCDIAGGKVRPGIVHGEMVEDMDSLPLLPWEDLVPRPYDRTGWDMAYPVYTLNTSRGCPFNCTFCSVKGIWGLRYRAMSAARVLEEVDILQRYYGMQAVYFREDHFTLDRHRTLDFCERVLQRERPFSWACESRADSIDDDQTLALMARAGCKTLYIGVESGSQRMLDLLKKGETVEQFRRVLSMARKHGIRTYASMIYGLPGESPEDIRQSEQFLRETRPDYVGRNVYAGLPGSDLYDQIVEQGLCAYEDPMSGIRYLKGHDQRARYYYGANTSLLIPACHKEPATLEVTQSPLVTVVTCVYNGAEHVSRCLESVQRQSYPHYEHIVVDDGSHDGTADILRQWAGQDSHIRVLTNDTNRQQSYSRNRAMAEAKGGLIAILDADDYAMPQRLEWQVEHFARLRNLTICGGGLRFRESEQTVFRAERNEQIRAGLLFRNPLLHSTVMFRKDEVLRLTDGYSTDVVNAQDYELWLRLAEHEEACFANLRRILVEYDAGPPNKAKHMWQTQKITVRTALERHMLKYDRLISSQALDVHLRAFEDAKATSIRQMLDVCEECVWCATHNTTRCINRDTLAYQLYEIAATLCAPDKELQPARNELLRHTYEAMHSREPLKVFTRYSRAWRCAHA